MTIDLTIVRGHGIAVPLLVRICMNQTGITHDSSNFLDLN